MKSLIFVAIFAGQVLDISSTIIVLKVRRELEEGNPFTKNLVLLSIMKIVFSIFMYFVALQLTPILGIILAVTLFCTGLFLAVHNLLML